MQKTYGIFHMLGGGVSGGIIFHMFSASHHIAIKAILSSFLHSRSTNLWKIPFTFTFWKLPLNFDFIWNWIKFTKYIQPVVVQHVSNELHMVVSNVYFLPNCIRFICISSIYWANNYKSTYKLCVKVSWFHKFITKGSYQKK